MRCGVHGVQCVGLNIAWPVCCVGAHTAIQSSSGSPYIVLRCVCVRAHAFLAYPLPNVSSCLFIVKPPRSSNISGQSEHYYASTHLICVALGCSLCLALLPLYNLSTFICRLLVCAAMFRRYRRNLFDNLFFIKLGSFVSFSFLLFP